MGEPHRRHMSDFTGDIEADFERISAAMETTNSDDPNFDTLLVASQTVAAAVYESRHRQVQEDAQLAEEWTHRCTLGDSQPGEAPRVQDLHATICAGFEQVPPTIPDCITIEDDDWDCGVPGCTSCAPGQLHYCDRCKEIGATHRARYCPVVADEAPATPAPAQTKRPRGAPSTTIKPAFNSGAAVHEVPPQDWAGFDFHQALGPNPKFELRTETGAYNNESTCHCDVPVVVKLTPQRDRGADEVPVFLSCPLYIRKKKTRCPFRVCSAEVVHLCLKAGGKEFTFDCP